MNSRLIAAFRISLTLSFLFFASVSCTSDLEKNAEPIPEIVITDLYHPYNDPGDNLDLINAFAWPELDLQAVLLDITDAFRKKVADYPTLWNDPRGPREAGFVPLQ